MAPHSHRNPPPGSPPPPLRFTLLDQVCARIRHAHYSQKIEKATSGCGGWGAFRGRHPRDGAARIYTHVLAWSAAGLASPLDSAHCAERPAAYLH